MSRETQRRKNKVRINKKELWDKFDKEIVGEDNQIDPLECIYRECGNRETCDTCSYNLAWSEEGFLTCTNNKCGIIYKDMIDNTAEWRYYGADDSHSDDPTRCGMPINPLLQESSFGCKVLCYGSTTYEMRKIRRYTEWQSMPYKEKSQYDDFQRITTMAHNAGMPKMIIDSAVRYHKKISEYDLTFRGDNRDGILASSIYISCRINNYPRTAKEIAEIFHLDITSATKGCKNAQLIINNLEINLSDDDKTSFGQTKPESFIERYCSKLNINQELTKLCHFISMKIDKKSLMPENTPNSTAAGIIYFVCQICNLNISKKEVKNVTNTSEVTVNKCYKKIEKLIDGLVPKAILKKYQ